MKKFVVFSIVFGVMLILVGSIMFGIGYKNRKEDKVLEKTVEIEESFNDININLKTADLELIKTDEANTKIIINETKKIIHNAKVESNTLKISVTDNRRWYERIFDFNQNLSVTVYLPNEAYNDLTITSATGYVKLAKEFTFENVTSKLSTGSFELKSNVNNKVKVTSSTGAAHLIDVAPKNVEVTSSTGNIYLTNVEAIEKINLHASTGSITLTDSKAYDLVVKTSTGGIRLTRFIAENDINLRASTGSVKFEDSDSNTIDVKTSTGSITGTLLNSKIFITQSDTGKIRVPETTTGGICKLVTDTGGINIQITE